MLERVPLLSVRQIANPASPFGNWPGTANERLRIAERPGLAIIELAAFRSAQGNTTALERALGLLLPGPGASTEAGGIAALSIGPSCWLIITPEADTTRLPTLPDSAAAITDLSHGRAVLVLTGPGAVETLMKGTAVDLHPALFGPGAVAATALARMPVVIWRRAAGYDVIVPRSYAASLLEWFIEAGGLS